MTIDKRTNGTAGSFPPGPGGDQLPKVRDVVSTLAGNPNTVLKAYKELETKGLAAGRHGVARERRGVSTDSTEGVA